MLSRMLSSFVMFLLLLSGPLIRAAHTAPGKDKYGEPLYFPNSSEGKKL